MMKVYHTALLAFFVSLNGCLGAGNDTFLKSLLQAACESLKEWRCALAGSTRKLHGCRAVGHAFILLGAKGMGDNSDYRIAKKPPVNQGLLDGQLAWRQHDGGHEDRTNMKYFIKWANRMLDHAPPLNY